MKNPRPEMFKQEGPRDELVALVSSCAGDLMVAKFGPNNQEQIARASHKMDLILEILRGMPTDKWSDP